MDIDIEKINKEMKTINPQHQGLRLTDGEIAMTKIVALEERIKKLEQRLEASPLDAIVGRTKGVVCPYCEHELSNDEMYQGEVDLYALAPNEDDAIIDCPACHEKFTVHGSYTPIYETMPLEME